MGSYVEAYILKICLWFYADISLLITSTKKHSIHLHTSHFFISMTTLGRSFANLLRRWGKRHPRMVGSSRRLHGWSVGDQRSHSIQKKTRILIFDGIDFDQWRHYWQLWWRGRVLDMLHLATLITRKTIKTSAKMMQQLAETTKKMIDGVNDKKSCNNQTGLVGIWWTLTVVKGVLYWWWCVKRTEVLTLLIILTMGRALMPSCVDVVNNIIDRKECWWYLGALMPSSVNTVKWMGPSILLNINNIINGWERALMLMTMPSGGQGCW